MEYLRQGACVAVNHFPDTKSASQYEAVVSEAGDFEKNLIGIPGDISKPNTGTELVQKTVEKWGRLDVLVSNAGICQFADFLKYVAGNLTSCTYRLRREEPHS